MAEIENTADEQDQSEMFDETHLDDEGDAEFLLDEADDVLDVTQADGDADEEAFDEDDLNIDDQLALDGIEAEADALLGVDAGRISEIDTESTGQRGPDEVELVYSGLMENERGAQASAAHWESKTLSDDDIEDLGYGPDDKQEELR
ncbi:hypothetical protein ASG17_11170 [Brevundimonas sp. Leaf363]|uniref:hypothetical protein n=1 Tax=Brevundimonas sp. Leaf363 TaxID=1736353 RepID=UPI0006FC15A5|nr:hypothetical protein [Brevundimonas sp. Leaf363]KQS54209.1 hypothetical protein ASG17_11170 [Brevundimonas sp. Leaf363]RZJ40470.1 MAG: hypothetical protein EON87_18055 [Brevundimonas sp.]